LNISINHYLKYVLARALLQSWAENIPTNLSLLNKNTKNTTTSSPLNKKDRIITPKRRNSTAG